MNETNIDPAANEYIDGIPADYRPLFDRIHRLIMRAHPEAALLLSYQLPTYKVGRSRLHVGVWKHGVSIYGRWSARDEFVARHPELGSGRGTIRMRLQDAEALSDEELTALVRGALD